jgi:hypothetical protein
MHSVQLCCQMNFEIAKSCDTPIFLLSFIVGLSLLSFLSFTENIRKYRKEHRGTSEISVTSVTSSLEGSAASSVAFCQSMPIHVNPCQSMSIRRIPKVYIVLLCTIESQMEKSSFPVASHATVFQLSETSQPRLNWTSLGVKSIAKCTGAFLLDTSIISGHIQTIPTNVLILLLSAKWRDTICAADPRTAFCASWTDVPQDKNSADAIWCNIFYSWFVHLLYWRDSTVGAT